MSNFRNITGKKFGMLLAIRPTDKRIDKKVVWEFICDCGNKINVTGKSVISGNTKSCGCYKSIAMDNYHAESRVNKICPECNKNFICKKSHALKVTYCSKQCMANAYKKTLKGENNPNYKNGISLDKNKYSLMKNKEWRNNNKDKLKLINQKNKMIRKNVIGSHTKKDLDNLLLRQNGVCPLCNEKLVENNIQLDHIIPVSKGGTNFIGNLQYTCAKCNISKNNMPSIKYKNKIKNYPSEDDIQTAFFNIIKLHKNKHPELNLLLHVPNGGYRNPREAAKLKRMGVSPGVPDCLLLVARGGYNGLAIEFKSHTGKLSENQIEYLALLEQHHWKTCIMRDAECAWVEVFNYLRNINH
jgi:hypothetical protein